MLFNHSSKIQEEDRLNEAEDIANGSGDHELLREMQVELLDKLHIGGVIGIKKVYRDKKFKVKWENDARGFETNLEVHKYLFVH